MFCFLRNFFIILNFKIKKLVTAGKVKLQNEIKDISGTIENEIKELLFAKE